MSIITFNKCFKEANETKKRYKVLLGSAGSGKSVNVAQDYIVKLSDPKNAGNSLLVVRGAEVTHLNSTWAELQGAINRTGLGRMWDTKLNPLTMTNKLTGNTIIFRGCNDQKAIERLKSVTVANGKIAWCWLEEATELRRTDFDIIDDRLRGELPPDGFYQISLTFNPINAAHWIKSDLWDYDSPNIYTHRSTFEDNRFIDDAYRERMERRKKLDPEGYEVYGLGNWGNLGGNILTNIVVGSYKEIRFDYYSMGMDFGFNHASVCLLIGWKNTEPYIVDEVYSTGETTAEIVKQMNEHKYPKDILLYCDSAEPDRIKEIKQAGYRAYPVEKEKNSVNNQIAWLRERTVYIDGGCSHSHKELVGWRWKKDPISGSYIDVPIAIEDDAPAALRYGSELYRKDSRLESIGKDRLGL